PSYGPESRGGTSYADVHVATEEVLSPACPTPHILVAFNPPSLEKFAPTVQRGGIVVYDSSVITKLPKLDNGIRLVGVPCAQIATDLGKPMVKNVVALGALQAATELFPKESFLTTMRQALKDRCALLEINEEAFAWGGRAPE
ncbi:MAG: 2-oxoacid:acceptor oxidoreductase family protein, partial [Gemmatimonadales bacterium]